MVRFASKMIQPDDGHEFEADFAMHSEVGACLTITDAFGNSVEIVGEAAIQALQMAADWSLLRARSVGQKVAA